MRESQTEMEETFWRAYYTFRAKEGTQQSLDIARPVSSLFDKYQPPVFTAEQVRIVA